MKSSVKWCVAACQDARCVTTVHLLLQPVNPKRSRSDKPNEMCLSPKDTTSIVGCSSVFHADKRSEGMVSLPLCSLTIWYYRYALTLCITKLDPAYAWYSELNRSLGTTTRNQPNRFGASKLSLFIELLFSRLSRMLMAERGSPAHTKT